MKCPVCNWNRVEEDDDGKRKCGKCGFEIGNDVIPLDDGKVPVGIKLQNPSA